MKRDKATSLVLAIALALAAQSLAQELSPAHIHIRHVMETMNGPPDNVGLLVILEAESAIAVQHANLAASDLSSLEAMQLHIKHVRHAVDPTKESAGPGKGFGVLRAAKGVETHITLSGRADGATENIKTHALHVATSAKNVVMWCEQLLAESAKVVAAETAEAAGDAVEKIAALAQQIVDGTDANKDGKTSWESDEGGIAQARQHMTILTNNESGTP